MRQTSNCQTRMVFEAQKRLGGERTQAMKLFRERGRAALRLVFSFFLWTFVWAAVLFLLWILEVAVLTRPALK
jgi:hypothetical protein